MTQTRYYEKIKPLNSYNQSLRERAIDSVKFIGKVFIILAGLLLGIKMIINLFN